MADSRLMMNLKGIGVTFVPRIFFQRKLKTIFDEITSYDDKNLEHIKFRLNHYNKINHDFSKDLHASNLKEKISKFPFKKTSNAYDGYKISKYFNDDFLWIKKYGDMREIMPTPTITKSRVICENNANNVLLKLDKNRHFDLQNDTLKFSEKKDLAVFRGAIYQANRQEFFKSYFDKKFCDIGHVGNGGGSCQNGEKTI